jgi:hypothetical protein
MTYNLLRDDPALAAIEEVLARHPRRPLLPPLGSEAWRRAAGNPLAVQWLQPLRARAGKEAEEPLPALTDELYAGFHRTGVRLAFEAPYFERRRRLARAAISLLLSREDDPWRQRLEDSMLAKLASIFEEVSWSLPAHVQPEDGKDPRHIDLFCAETANLMAEMLDLFGHRIPAALREKIRARLLRDLFENYLEKAPPFWWKSVTHNWNAVCHQGVIGAALSQLDDTHLLASLLAEAGKCLPFFLAGFGPDGGSSEGPGYWNYGFGWFAVLNEQLELRTGRELSLFEGDGHVREIARYGPRMSLLGGRLVNFADSGASGGLRPALLSYLDERLGEPACRGACGDNYRRLAHEGLNLDAERCDLFYLARLFLRCPEDPAAMEAVEREDCFLPDLGVLVAHGTDRRGHRWDFAAKAGHNGEHHNHNDCGSYIVNIDGVRFVAEIGAPEYVKDFFGEKRYGFLAARTLGHSLPVINGCEQAAGASHASRVLGHSLGASDAAFVVDATSCYPPAAGCAKFLRSFRFYKSSGKLVVEDTFGLERMDSLETAVIAVHPLLIFGGHAVIQAEDLKVALKPLPGTRLDRVETLPYRNHEGKDACVQRLILCPSELAARVVLGVEITLL